MLEQLDNSNISKHLGKSSEYKAEYDASLLVREPRASNRKHLGISDDSPPFIGNDTWNNYEVSGLMRNGVPVTAIAKIVYPATNKYIVESKSLKLYFGSFHMTKLGDTPAAVREAIAQIAAKDLSALLETTVQVHCYSDAEIFAKSVTAHTEWEHDKYVTLEESIDTTKLTTTTYMETPELLEVAEQAGAVLYHSSLLRSRCRVTSQPDSGDIYIYIKGLKTVSDTSLLKYIISFRDECHFHEEICEAVYKRLWDLLQPEELSVKCLYARRGSIDINPERVSHAHLLHNTLSNVDAHYVKTPRQ
jgi:7-cyano-7-deazaguanine reductase